MQRCTARILCFSEALAKKSRPGGKTEPTKPKTKKTLFSIPQNQMATVII